MRWTFRSGVLGVATFALAHATAASGQVAEHPFLATALTFCRANHSRAAGVLAAADGAGWRTAPMTMAGMQMRAKVIDGKRQTLIVMTMPIALGGGVNVVAHLCQVGGSAPIGDVQASVRAFMGGRAPIGSGNFVEWYFTERDGRREFLPDDSPATMATALKVGPITAVHVPSLGTYVMYNEIVAAP